MTDILTPSTNIVPQLGIREDVYYDGLKAENHLGLTEVATGEQYNFRFIKAGSFKQVCDPDESFYAGNYRVKITDNEVIRRSRLLPRFIGNVATISFTPRLADGSWGQVEDLKFKSNGVTYGYVVYGGSYTHKALGYFVK